MNCRPKPAAAHPIVVYAQFIVGCVTVGRCAPTSCVVEHAGKLWTAGAATAGANAAWVTMQVKVRILGDRIEKAIVRDSAMHQEIHDRLNRHEGLLAEQGTAIRLLQHDMRHINENLDHFLDEQAALERAERYAEIQVETLKKARLLKDPDHKDGWG